MIAKQIATVGGAGFLKPGPGTWGSLAGLILAYPIMLIGGMPLLFIAFVAVTAIGTWASDIYAKTNDAADPSEVVIDEVAGLWLVLLFSPFSLLNWLIAFAAFRLFDIWKPWPISLADRKVKGGLGIMLDDLLAGLTAALLHWVVRKALLG